MTAALRITENADLTRRNSFAVPARAPRLVECLTADALLEAHARGLVQADTLVLGGGSNLLWVADPQSSILALLGDAHAVSGEADGRVRVRAEAGCNWHAFVQWCVEQDLWGLENLALIPGTVGAAPIQNIGAYGVEVGEHILAVEAMQREDGVIVRIGREACGFGYRDSVFKQQPGRWIVTAVEFELARSASPRLGYAGLGEALAGIDAPGPRQVFDAVCNIRRAKLPDPSLIGNAGSFFKNPIVPEAVANTLAQAHPRMPSWPVADAALRKLSAAWLIEQAGWKGRREGDAGVSPQHALVLVNHGQASGAELLALARAVAADVQARFGVAIEPEPRLIGAQW